MHRPLLLALLAAFATTGVWAVGSVKTKTAHPSADDTDVPLADEQQSRTDSTEAPLTEGQPPDQAVREEIDLLADEVSDHTGPLPWQGEAPEGVRAPDEGTRLASDVREDDAREVNHIDVKVKRRFAPKYPKAGMKLGIDTVPCRVRMYIDERGVPYRVGFVSCRVEFRDSAREALMKWRWYPALNEQGRPTKATFAIVIKYTLRDAAHGR